MYYLLLAILLVSSVLLIILVLMQSGKGGGLSGAFGAGGGGGESSLFGAGTATVIMKATGVFATLFMISCIAVAIIQRHQSKPKFPKPIQEELGSVESEDTGITGVEVEEEGEKAREGESSAPDTGDTGLTVDEDESAANEGAGAEAGEDTESVVEDADAVGDAAETNADNEKSD